MEDIGGTGGIKHQKRINVPVIHPLAPAFSNALHLCLIALVLVTSIFAIAFATFSSAYAFSLDEKDKAANSTEYRISETNILPLGLVVKQPPKQVLPNVEETAFNSMIFSKAASAARQIEVQPLPPVVHRNNGAKSVETGRSSLTGPARNFIAVFLVSLFAFMIWITGQMWRGFARKTWQNGRH